MPEDVDGPQPYPQGIYRPASSPPDPLEHLHMQAMEDEVVYEALWYIRRAAGEPMQPWEVRKLLRLHRLRAHSRSAKGRNELRTAVLNAWPALPWCWQVVQEAEAIVAQAYRDREKDP